MKTCEKIVAYQQYLGFSNEQLSNVTKLSRQDILELQSGQIQPSEQTLLTLSKLFRISVDMLISGKNIDDDFKEGIEQKFCNSSDITPHDQLELNRFARYLSRTSTSDN